jgi:phosphatidate cytidylyltransferase
MLKQRIMTAGVLIPLIVLAVLNTSTATIQWILGLFILLAAWEWFDVIGLKTGIPKTLAFIALAIAGVLMRLYVDTSSTVLIAGVLWTLFAAMVIVFAHKAIPSTIANLFTHQWLATLTAVVTLVVFFQTTILLHQVPDIGPRLMLFVMVAVWLADTGGYFAGKRWGKHRLASMISPNKTWQGVAGAMLFVLIGALISYFALLNGPISLLQWLLLIVIAAGFSIIGDLIESVFKRSHDVKDSGNLLPGHGGVLDRIDSLLAAIPVFVIGLYFIGVI